MGTHSCIHGAAIIRFPRARSPEVLNLPDCLLGLKYCTRVVTLAWVMNPLSLSHNWYFQVTQRERAPVSTFPLMVIGQVWLSPWTALSWQQSCLGESREKQGTGRVGCTCLPQADPSHFSLCVWRLLARRFFFLHIYVNILVGHSFLYSSACVSYTNGAFVVR